jgi:hypothetical protein
VIHRFNAEGLTGLGDRGRPGRPRRLSEDERSRIVALVKTMPPGRLHYDPGAEALVQSEQTSTAAVWTLDALTEAANAQGIRVAPLAGAQNPAGGRGPVAAGPVVGRLQGPGLRPKRTAVIDLYTRTPTDTTVVCADELGPLIPRAYPPQPGWTADGNRVKEQVAYWREPDKTWVYGRLRIRDGHAVTMCAERATASATRPSSPCWNPRTQPVTSS